MQTRRWSHWTLEEEAQLAKAYQSTPQTQLDFCKSFGNLINRTPKSVLNRIYYLGLDSTTTARRPALVRFETLYAVFLTLGEPDEKITRDNFLHYLMDVYEEEAKALDLLNQANRQLAQQEAAHGNQNPA